MAQSNTNEIRRGIFDHVDAIWQRHPKKLVLPRHTTQPLPADFRIIKIGPHTENPLDPWVYLSLGAWEHTRDNRSGIELMLLAPSDHDRHIATLSLVLDAHHERAGGLQPGDVVSLGASWLPGGNCDHLMVTLPYPYGPILEQCDARGFPIRILWLLPITNSEADFVRRQGAEALENRLEARAVDFMQANRRSLA